MPGHTLAFTYLPVLLYFMQSDCRIIKRSHIEENLVLQAVMDEHEENREVGNITTEILNREKVK